MKANKNSLHAKLYEFTYSSYLPDNLCPYFWKLVWAIIVLVPNFIIQFPALIIQIFSKSSDDCGDRRGMGTVIYIIGFFLSLYFKITFHLIKGIFNCYSYSQEFAIWGGIINTIIFIISAVFFIKYLLGKRRKRIEEKRPNIIVEFAKAKYGKYCPKIDWE